jgi:hypothetical protein
MFRKNILSLRGGFNAYLYAIWKCIETLMQTADTVANMQQRMIASISRSAVVILSSAFNKRLTTYFTASELVLVLACMHTILNTIRTVPGFNASWRMLRDMVQFAVVHALASYVSGKGGVGEQESLHQTAVLNLLLVLIILEAIPTAGALNGWVLEDMESFTSSVSYIFSDHISDLLTKLGIPLAGAGLALCLGGHGKSDPLLYRTLAFVGINTLSTIIFAAISGGELSLIWPLTLLYFIHELSSRFDVETFFSYGLYNASDAIYQSLTAARALPPSTIAIGFVFLSATFPTDPVWTGVCVLVFVQGVSNWFMQQVAFVAADPALAGLCVVTGVHFVSIVVERNSRSESKVPQ